MYLTRSMLLLAIIFFSYLQSSQAQQQKIDSLISVLNSSKADSNQVNTLSNLSKILAESKPDQGLQYATQGIALSRKIGYRRGENKCFNTLGLAFLQLVKYDTARVCFEKHLEISHELGDSLGIAEACDNMSILDIHQGRIEKALESRKRAIEIYVSLDEKDLLASGYTWIGNIYKEKGEYDKALDNYFGSIKLYQELKNEDDIAYPLLNISSVYRYLKQYVEAKEYVNEAKTKFIKMNNRKGTGVSLYRLALIYFEEKDYQNAIKYYTEAKGLFEETKDTYFTFIVDQALGICYHDMGNIKIALEYAENELRTAQQIGDVASISATFQNISILYSDRGDYSRALQYMHSAEKITNGLKDKKTLLNLSANFIDLYSRANKPDSVAIYFKKYQTLSDTIFNEQNSRSIAELQTKYETEKKDREILALNLETQKKKSVIWAISSGAVLLLVFLLSGFVVFRNKKKREQAVLSLMVSESDRKALRAQLNPHFIFNCIHTINELLNELKINESKTCLDQFSTLTRSVLENSEKREIPLSAELETLRLYMNLENMRFTKPFQYEFVIESGIDPETTLVPPLILQPFVENSIKHGFRDRGKVCHIKIEIRIENGFLVCDIEDNGIGRTESMRMKPISGFKKESLGIKLTEERLELISAAKRVKSCFLIDDLKDAADKPAGTLVKIYLPFELSV